MTTLNKTKLSNVKLSALNARRVVRLAGARAATNGQELVGDIEPTARRYKPV